MPNPYSHSVALCSHERSVFKKAKQTLEHQSPEYFSPSFENQSETGVKLSALIDN